MPSFTGDPDRITDLVQVYRGSVPADIANQNRSLDEAWAMAAIFGSALATIALWSQGIFIFSSSGSQVDAQGTNVGITRQGSEPDATLIARLQIPPTAGTRTSILTAVQQIVDANGGGIVFLIELPRDGACLSRSDGVGGPFCNRFAHFSGGPVRMVIACIPASANSLTSATDAVRARVSAAKAYLVQEYTG